MLWELTPEEWERYHRQLGPGVLSPEGQQRLRNSAVLVARVGGMGGPAAMMLAMAGIGRVVIAHGGNLLAPDLNRQVLGSGPVRQRPTGAEPELPLLRDVWLLTSTAHRRRGVSDSMSDTSPTRQRGT